MIIKLRNYPLSTKLSTVNGALLCLDIFLSFGLAVGILMMFGGPGSDFSGMALMVSFGIPLVIFFIAHRIINRYTDKKYEVVLAQYKEMQDKLTNENPEDVKDKQLTRPANITFTRLAVRAGWMSKQKYIINGTTYTLGNGETINITSNKALNTIEIKSLTANDFQYFTVKDGEQITIEYALCVFKNVTRK